MAGPIPRRSAAAPSGPGSRAASPSPTEPELLAPAVAAGAELDDGELLVSRHVTAAGRSRAYLGGAQVPAPVCAGVTEPLITIHGQSEQTRLGTADRQRELLDRFAGEHGRAGADPLSGRVRRAPLCRRGAGPAAVRGPGAGPGGRPAAFRAEEIEQVDPQPGEDVALAAEARRLQSADDLRQTASTALARVAGGDDEAGGALSDVTAARKTLEAGIDDETLTALAGRLAELGYGLADVAGDLAGYLGDLEAEPGRLEQIAARRAALAGLTRKYGASADEVLAWGADAAVRLAELEGGDDRVEVLAARVGELDGELAELAVALTEARRAAADGFARAVVTELVPLAMPHARLVFPVTPVEPGPSGADQVELLFSANPGSEPRSLAKVASGGELSRIRLALEVVLAAGRPSGTLVFDEVDAGVGGRVATEIGRRLAQLARHNQVVVVTHLAQVAAFADRHYVVVKADDGQVTTSGVSLVTDEQRAAELARMMAGLEATESALAHAGELVELAAASRRDA